MYLESHMAQPALMLCRIEVREGWHVGEEHISSGRVGRALTSGKACPVRSLRLRKVRGLGPWRRGLRGLRNCEAEKTA